MKIQMILVFIPLLFGCKEGVRQELIVSNKSSNNIFYCIHSDSIPDMSSVKKIRPWTDDEIKKHHRNLKFHTKEDSIENARSLRTTYLIKKGRQKVIFSSRAVEMFLDKESIQEQIRNEYVGCLYVSIIAEDDLVRYSDKEIIENGFYRVFLSLNEDEIKENTMKFIYY